MVCGTLSFNIKILSIIGVQHLFQPIPPTIVLIQQNMPNAPMVWGAQPYKNYIFLSDMNSGLYCIEIIDENSNSLGTN